MKRIIAIALILAAFTAVKAQEVKKEIKKDTNAVGNKTAEVASKTAAAVTDQVYKDKVGPDGQTIYIDNHSKYYWVDKKGKHQPISAAQLKDKEKK